MTGLCALIRRNTKLYFKDKGMFFTSLITPMILLVLYSTFLANVYEDSFRSALEAAGASVSDKVIWGCVGGELVSSLLAVSCVTVAFCSNLLMVQDNHCVMYPPFDHIDELTVSKKYKKEIMERFCQL